uniref:PHD-type domain-containing protein n=1 Tax=Clastoptera arizonana TaxID=38151 RepID=A0A1B6CB00_9HEMI
MSGVSRKRGQEKEIESTAVPDSTTKDRSFCSGDEVLVQRKDGNFYLGTVVQVELIQEQCLIKFGDNTDQWSSFKNLTKLNVRFDTMCVICKKSQPKKDNAVIVCDRCARGYHQLCHQPTIATGISCWHCRRCEDKPTKPLRPIRKAAPPPPPAPTVVEKPKNQLPYDLDSLVWDIHHRVNSEHKYCYCGKPGEWFIKMLQCGRCRQWFHEKCLRCLQYPLHLGDRFYIFLCSLCNGGSEFVRRFEMKWVDLVHLAIFNLTVYNGKKYHEVDSDIVQYINSNWLTFQLPPKIQNTSIQERRDIIMYILTNNRNRFKCGREIKKRATIWGLHIRIPPLAPMFVLPSSPKITDAVLRSKWSSNKRLKFLPPLSPRRIETNVFSPPNGELPTGPGPYLEPPPGIRILHIDTRPLLFPKGMSPTGHKIILVS